MFVLKIKKPGLHIDVPGMSAFRTPATIKIKPNQISMIVSELHKLDIQDYEIIPDSSSKKPVTIKVGKKEVERTDDDPLNSRLIKIESLLEKILKKDPTIIERVMSDEESVIKKSKIEEDEVVDFIPTINTDGMEVSGKDAIVKHEKSSNNAENNADLLRQVKRKV